MQLATLATQSRLDRELTGTTELVCSAFARVLHRAKVEPGDDFFDLGGDSILAVSLILEVEEALGVRVPSTALFDAPTAASLARLLAEQAGATPPLLDRLKAGTGGPPLFLLPGVGGSTLDLLPLAKLIRTDGPIYGLRAPGLNEQEEPLDRIETMAAHYLPLIRAVQPDGPYFLVGNSMGGLTAVEIARMLIQAGEEVPLLVLLDTIVHPKDLPLAIKIRIWGRRAGLHLARMRGLKVTEALGYAAGRVPGLLADFGAGVTARRARRTTGRPLPPAIQRVTDRSFAALTSYRPHFLPARLTYVEAVDDWGVPRYPEIVWGRNASGLTVHVMDGDHADMIGSQVGVLASILSRCLRDAIRVAVTGASHKPV